MIKKFNFIFILSLCALIIFSSVNICNASASSKSFGSSELISARDSVDFSVYGLKKLGYDPTYEHYGDIHIYDHLLPWINNTGNGYAFYLQMHGEQNRMIDSFCNTLEPYEVGGNWDLVFLDFSYSAATSDFAYAFNTIGYSNRAYLGWDNEIYTTQARLFAYYFWCEEVTTATLQRAGIFASASIGGSASAPFAFYGDPAYEGYAR